MTLGDGANIWCGACIRGDLAPVVIGRNTNVQDNATVHVGYGAPAVLGDNVTVGHNAVVHGADGRQRHPHRHGFSVVLDGARIGEGCVIGAATLIPGAQGDPRRCSVVFGNPYRIVRQATEADRQGNLQNAAAYLRLAEAFAAENTAE